MTEHDQPQRRSPSPRRPIPPHWKELMDRRGLASVRALANRAGLSQPAVNKLVYGDGARSAEDTLAKVAAALDIPLADVYWLAGEKVPHAETWTPPAEANRLTTRQRAALEGLILAIVEPAEQAVEVDPGPSNVHHLHPERDGLDVAAHKGHGPAEGQQMWDLGEEDQDEGGDQL